MNAFRTCLTTALALVLILGSGCGGNGVIQPPGVVVLSLNDVDLPGADPVVLDLVEPVTFTVRGEEFGEPGGIAKVIFRTVDGSRPFVGNTLSSIEVPGDIVSDTEIEGVLALPGVADPVVVTIEVELSDGSVSEPKPGVQIEDSSLVAPLALGPARLLDLDADGTASQGDEIVILFEREIEADGPVVVSLAPDGSLGANPADPYVAGADDRELHVPLGSDPKLRTRHVYDAGIVTNAPTAIVIPTDSGVTNVVDEAPESEAVLDIVAGFAVGRELVDAAAEPVVSDTRDLLVEDLNGDGTPDLLAVDHRGALVLYPGRKLPAGLGPAVFLPIFAIQTEEDGSRTRVGVTIGTGFFTAAAAGDLDGDCRPDLVVTRSGGLDWVLFWNEAEGGYERVQQLSFLDSTSVALGDLDRDGDLDIVTGSKGGGTRVFGNDPDEDGLPFQDSGLRLDPEFVTQSVVLDDMDRDGDLDIVLGNFGEPNTVWLNSPKDPEDDTPFPRTFGTRVDLDMDGEDDAWIGEPIMTPARTFGLAGADLDGDGDRDYVEAIFDGQTRIWIREDDGASRFREHQTLEETTGDRRSVVLGDVDGDGDVDICVGTASDGTSVWLNDGTGVFTDSRQRLGAGRVRSLALADFDMDGDPDLVTGHPGAADRLWFNSLSGSWGEARFADRSHPDLAWTASVAIGPGASGEDFRVASVDAAGRGELWKSTGGALERIRTVEPGPAARDVALGDFDGDPGTPADLAVAHADGITIEWGDGVTVDTTITGNYLAVAFLHLDGNAQLDLVAVVSNGLLVWRDGDVASAPESFTAPTGEFREVAAADLNGDGTIDLIGAHSEGIDIWPDATPAGRIRESIAGGVFAAVAFNVDGDTLTETRFAARNETGVVIDATNEELELAAGWTVTPPVNQQIEVDGSSDNDGTYTVTSASNTVIAVSPALVTDDPAGQAITISWTVSTSVAALDLVAVTPTAVVHLRNLGTRGAFEFANPAPIQAMVATGLAANGDTLAASDVDGFIAWKNGAGPIVVHRDSRDGPRCDAVAVGTSGEIVLARPGAGDQIVDQGLFGYAKQSALLRDFDRDGDLDFLVTESDGINRIYWNTDGELLDPVEVGHGFGEAGDLDRDGDLDLVTGTANGRDLQVWRNDAGQFTKDAAVLPAGVVRGARIARLFRGGWPGILAITADAILLFENDEGSLAGPGASVAEEDSVLDLAVGDIDGDCLADLVLAKPEGVWRYVATPDGLFERAESALLESAGDTRSLVLADLVPDGRLDLVTAGRGGAVLLWSAFGTTNAPAAPIDATPGWTEAMALADVDGDGVLDLVRSDFGGENRLLRSRVFPPTVAQPGGRWTTAVAIGDIDRDGDLDLVFRSLDLTVPDVEKNE